MKLELSLYNGFKTIEEFDEPTNDGKVVDFEIECFQWTYGGLRLHEKASDGLDDKYHLPTIESTEADGKVFLLIQYEGYYYSDFQVRPL